MADGASPKSTIHAALQQIADLGAVGALQSVRTSASSGQRAGLAELWAASGAAEGLPERMAALQALLPLEVALFQRSTRNGFAALQYLICFLAGEEERLKEMRSPTDEAARLGLGPGPKPAWRPTDDPDKDLLAHVDFADSEMLKTLGDEIRFEKDQIHSLRKKCNEAKTKLLLQPQ